MNIIFDFINKSAEKINALPQPLKFLQTPNLIIY